MSTAWGGKDKDQLECFSHAHYHIKSKGRGSLSQKEPQYPSQRPLSQKEPPKTPSQRAPLSEEHIKRKLVNYVWFNVDELLLLSTLAHLVTYERTATLSINKVVRLAAKRYGTPMGDYILNLYERVKKGYNDYVDLIGGAIGAGACAAIKKGNRVYTIADDIPLLHFLTGD